MSSHIPLDIQLEIMKRLPLKSLIRFMSTCKAWKSLIDCSRFVSGFRVVPANHLLVQLDNGNFEENYICFADDDTYPKQKLALALPPLLGLLDEPRIIGTSCGLFCFSEKTDPYRKRGMVVLWNPSIRKSVAVAVVVPDHPPVNYYIGFGVCPSTKDPKLVKIIYAYPYWQVMVFSLSSGEWRCLCSNQRPPIKSNRVVIEHTVIGQFIYWLTLDKTDGLRKLIMSFDLSTDEFREVDLPRSLRKSNFFISSRRESLVLLVYNYSPAYFCDVWMMGHGGDRKTFTKLFTIEPLNAYLNTYWRTVGFRTSGQPIIERMLLRGALAVYEPCSRHTKDFAIYGTGHLHWVYSYMESLLLLDHDDGHVVSLRCGDVKT